MENEPNKYISREEYIEEFKKTGGDNIFAFLIKKIREAKDSGDVALVKHIIRIYNDLEKEIYYDSNDFSLEEYKEELDDEQYTFYKASLDWLEIPELQHRYEDMLEEIKKYEKELDAIRFDIDCFDEEREPLEKIDALGSEQEEKMRLIEASKQKLKILQNKIKMKELDTRIKQMSPEGVAKEYNELLLQRTNYEDMQIHGTEIHPLDFEFIDNALGLIERYSTFLPDLEAIIQEQKGNSKGTEENENTTEQSQPNDLASLSVEELIERFNSNNQTITNNEQVIKEELILRILGQQQQIAEQEAEISRLQGQKEL